MSHGSKAPRKALIVSVCLLVVSFLLLNVAWDLRAGTNRTHKSRVGHAEHLFPAKGLGAGGRPAIGYIDQTGRLVIPYRYLITWGRFSEGLAAVQPLKSKMLGYIDKKGTMVISPRFDDAFPFSNGLARVQKGGKTGFIDKSGKFIVPPQYEDGHDFSEGRAAIQDKDGLWGYINRKGEVLIQAKFVSARSFFEGRAAVQTVPGVNPKHPPAASQLIMSDQGQWGLIDQHGRWIVKPKYDAVGNFSEGMASVIRDGRSGYINRKGKIVIPLDYRFAGDFSEGLVPALKQDRWGFLNKHGQWVIPPRFDQAGPFSDGLAYVKINHHILFIDRTGRTAIRLNSDYTWAVGFHHGLCLVNYMRRKAYINKTGKRVWTSPVAEIPLLPCQPATKRRAGTEHDG